jgi:hypothetical protein
MNAMVVGSAEGGIMEDVVVGCGFCVLWELLCASEKWWSSVCAMLTHSYCVIFLCQVNLGHMVYTVTPNDNVLTQWLQCRIQILNLLQNNQLQFNLQKLWFSQHQHHYLHILQLRLLSPQHQHHYLHILQQSPKIEL